MRRRTTTRLITTSALALGILFSTTAPASADHHFMSIREVYPGTMVPNDVNEFVELQMYAAGQSNLFNPMNPTHLRVYASDGMAVATYDPTSDPPNAQNQQSILFASPGADAEFGPNGDYPMLPQDDIQPAGGAVCFYSDLVPNIDCVAWGTFDNSTLMLPVGVPETGPIPNGSSITRSIAANCPTALDGADDTNDSQADFSATAPTPRNNAGAITETSCTPPATNTPPGNPTSPINPAGNVRKRKCKKSKGASAAKKKCKKKKK